MKKREASANDKALQKANSANEVQRAGRAELMASINEEICQVTGVKAVEVANQIVSQMRAMQLWASTPAPSHLLIIVTRKDRRRNRRKERSFPRRTGQ